MVQAMVIAMLVLGQATPLDDRELPRLEQAEHLIALRGGGYFPVLTKLADGRLGAVVRGGAPHIGIKGRLDWITSEDGGRTWSAPQVIADSEWDDRNPAVGQMPDGTIVVAYAEARTYDAQGKFDRNVGEYHFFFRRSTDGGKTWGEKQPLYTGAIRNGSPYGHIILLSDGTALMSLYGRRDPAWQGPPEVSDPARYLVGLVRSRDNGQTWGDFSLISASGHNETQLVALTDQHLLAMLRTDAGGINQSESLDGGRTWSQPKPILDPPHHPADITRLASGRLLLCYGNRQEPFGAGAMLSEDGGKTWQYDRRVMLGWRSLHRDCGYPSTVQLADGTIVTMYYSVGARDWPPKGEAIADELAVVVRYTEAQLEAAGQTR